MNRFSNLLILFLLVFSSCGPSQARLEGNWYLISYKDHGKDQLETIKKLRVGNRFSFGFRDTDPDDHLGSWGSIGNSGYSQGDTSFGIGGGLTYNRPVMTFSQTFYSIASGTTSIHSTINDTVFKKQIPLYLFDGDWKLNKKGGCRMEFERKNDKKVIMIFEKASQHCNR